MSVDLPDPETPEIVVSKPRGISALILFKLLPEALMILIVLDLIKGKRASGSGMVFLPDRYCPVKDAVSFMISAGVPCAVTLPPCIPAPGPTSNT